MLQATKYIVLLVLLGSTPSIAANERLTSEYDDIPRLKSHYLQKIDSALHSLNAKNFESAYEKLSNTARWGHKESQFYLSTMYLQGQGTEQDVAKAWVWLNLALEQRNTDWVTMKKRLAKYIPENAQQALEKEIEVYKSKYGAKAKGLVCRAKKGVGSNRLEERCEHKWTL